MDPHLDRLERLLSELQAQSSEPGWDGERGLPVSATTWEDAHSILYRLPASALMSPGLHVSMAGDGFVHVSLSRSGRGTATLEIGHGKYYWTWLRGRDESDTVEVGSSSEGVERLVRFLLAD